MCVCPSLSLLIRVCVSSRVRDVTHSPGLVGGGRWHSMRVNHSDAAAPRASRSTESEHSLNWFDGAQLLRFVTLGSWKVLKTPLNREQSGLVQQAFQQDRSSHPETPRVEFYLVWDLTREETHADVCFTPSITHFWKPTLYSQTELKKKPTNLLKPKKRPTPGLKEHTKMDFIEKNNRNTKSTLDQIKMERRFQQQVNSWSVCESIQCRTERVVKSLVDGLMRGTSGVLHRPGIT